jgi:hypothetical protein
MQANHKKEWAMNKNKPESFSIKGRKKERECIEEQIEAFLNKGGEIEVLGSPFDKNNDPKCRLGEETGLFT